MKHEIEIEGLPEGWDPVAVAVPGEGEKIWTAKGIVSTVSAIHCEPALIVRRKVRKYDWSKTESQVLCVSSGVPGFWLSCDQVGGTKRLAKVWQPNIHGVCPVDPVASIVRVRLADGQEYEILAGNIGWGTRIINPIVAYQFVRLADGVEW